MRQSKIVITIIMLFLCFSGISQFDQNDKKQIVIGEANSLYSEILQEQREIWIHTPEGIDSTKQYPVIYVLDASEHFYVVTGMLKQLTPFNIPESIIVGITNTDRIRDFTPTNVAFQRGRESKTSGGAHDFIKFIEKELKPYLKSNYPVNNMSTIVGHSTGGLFVVYAYTHHLEVFDNYLAIDPSLWWDKENLVTQSIGLINKSTHQNESLYIAVANSSGIDTVKIRKLNSEQTEMLRANLKFHDVLLKNSSQLDFVWDYQGSEDHGSVVVPGLYNGLRSLFSWYPFPERWRFNTPKHYTSEELTEPFFVHFEEMSKRFKREVRPKWQFINDVGFFLLTGHNLPKKSRAYLEMNLRFYPDESRSYVAMGDYYTIRKKKSEAINFFEKAVGIDGNKEAQAKLKALNKDK